jgi:hypothetical protein
MVKNSPQRQRKPPHQLKPNKTLFSGHRNQILAPTLIKKLAQ